MMGIGGAHPDTVSVGAPRSPQPPQGISISVQAIGKTFRPARGEPVVALAETDLEIGAGEFVCILGPSGCGKSTLLAAIAGLDRPTKGSIRVGGTVVTKPYTAAGFVFQKDLLLDWRTSVENVLLQFEMRGLPAKASRDRALQLLDLVGLSGFADSYPRQLSGGMRQRVAICRALAHDPPLLLMDEPFGALDALTREQLNAELAALSSESQKTVVFVTHSISEAVFLGDRVVVLSPRPGRVIADVPIALSRPRVQEIRDTTEFVRYTREIRAVLAQAEGH